MRSSLFHPLASTTVGTSRHKRLASGAVTSRRRSIAFPLSSRLAGFERAFRLPLYGARRTRANKLGSRT